MIPRPRSTPVPTDEWAKMMMRLYMDGPHGPGCCEVVRRFVAGEIEERPQPLRWDDERTER